MIILVINLEECYLERVTLTDAEERSLEELADDGDFDYYELVEGILARKGYFTQDPALTWMIADDIPVYDHGESIPYITIS